MKPQKTIVLLFTASALLFLSAILIPTLGCAIWIAFVPFLIAVSRLTPLKSFFFGLIIGIVFFVSLLYWITFYNVRIFVTVIALTLPFFSSFGLLTSWFWKKWTNNYLRAFVPSIAWTAITFLYSLTPLEIIGDQVALIQAPVFPGIVRVAGISGIAFLILLTNSIIALWLTTKQKIFRNGFFAVLLVLAAGIFPPARSAQSTPVKVALVQHNFPISASWRMPHRKDILATYEKVIRDFGNTVDLIIFPQYGLPIDPLREPEWLDKLARLEHTSILLGTYIPKSPGGTIGEGEQFDIALLFSPERSVQEYRAVTPPPFRKIGQVRGTKRAPLLLGNTKIGVMLCYEDARPEEGRMWVKAGSEVVVALSNTGHFLGTPLPRYHLRQDQIRAIEIGKYIIRVSPNGFSAIVDPNGKITVQSKLGNEEVLKGVIYPNEDLTQFVKVGPVLPQVSTLLSLVLLIGSYGRDSMKRFARKIR